MSAHRHITPRVGRWLAGTLPLLPAKRRVSYPNAALVLHGCSRWARRVDEHDPGRWVVNDTLEQIAAGVCLSAKLVQAALDNLERVGLVVTVTRGGGAGFDRRGSVRHLLLDPVDDPNAVLPSQTTLDLVAGRPAFYPQLAGVSPDELTAEQACGLRALQAELAGVSPDEFNTQLAGVEAGTRRGRGGNSPGSAPTLRSSSVVDTPLLPSSSTDDETADGIPDWLVGRWGDRLPQPKVST